MLLSYNNDGTLDSGFATSGISVINYEQDDYLTTAQLQSDGKFVLLVTGGENSYNPVVRYITRCFGYPQPLLITQKR